MYLLHKTTFQKGEQKILIHRDFKNVTYTDFQSEQDLNLSEPKSHNSYEYCTFDKSFVKFLYKHAPKRRKILHGNHKHYAITKCSQLKIKIMKLKSKNDVFEYKKQHNLNVKVKKHCEKRFFDNLETKNKSKPFWSTSKPYFFNKHSKGDADILLIEKSKVFLDNRKVANVFSQSQKTLTYFYGQMSR